jgi:hypothetical protein
MAEAATQEISKISTWQQSQISGNCVLKTAAQVAIFSEPFDPKISNKYNNISFEFKQMCYYVKNAI